jgi:hypothetical protein
MAVSIWFGTMRQGKTLHMARYVIYRNLIYGRRVISNTPFFYKMPDGHIVQAECYDDFERYKYEFMAAKGALVVTDEMSIFFEGRRWSNLESSFNEQFRQGAKDGCDLFGTSQSFMDTVANLRRITANFYFCKKSYWLIPFPVDLRYKVYNKKRGFYDQKGWFLHTPLVYDCIKVDPYYFKTSAQLAENRDRFIQGRHRIYPSEFRRIAPFYEHEYRIKMSAVAKKGGGKLTDYHIYKNWDEYMDIVLNRKKPVKLSTNAVKSESYPQKTETVK